ncbi:hypothetical protein [Alteribacillus bidgolensis]|uniref:Ferric reductase like transmembrane component n=1 Tax=Alteribacillus bidgolensis TaxID=930129 RepID=A0A1G8PJE9_9BACI|nr:hypothetical protein [Alteribacillus bidgolensis]SDI92661.1 hypothetical protein SAMN05216352_1152 [Alteribacillus bidgolensis]
MLRFLFRLNVVQSLVILIVPTIFVTAFLLLKQPSHIYTKLVDFAAAAMFYFLLAFLLYPLLLGVKYTRRKKLVIFTRIYIRFHIAAAILGTVLLLPHVIGMSFYYSTTNPKALTGLFAVCSFFAVLISGYLRKKRSSGKRRRYHRYTAFLFIVILFVHIVI